MSAEERQVLAEHEERFGPYGGRRWQLEARIRELSERAESAPAEPTSESQGGEA